MWLHGRVLDGAHARGRAGMPVSRDETQTPAILLTGVGKRYDIVACFAALTRTIAADPNPLAPAQYAAQVRAAVPPIADAEYVPALAELCARHGVGAVIPLTDLDIEVLAQARAEGRLPALVPAPEVARATYDKYEAHLLLRRHGLPSPPTALPGEDLDALDYADGSNWTRSATQTCRIAPDGLMLISSR